MLYERRFALARTVEALVGSGRSGWRRERRRAGFALVSGDFVKTGGMDRANYALASYLARRGRPVHLVAHRADADLVGQGAVTLHRVPKPLNSYLLGEPLLDRAGRRWAARVAAAGGRVVVNGGNCDWGDVNWVHYVHAAWPPRGAGGLLRRAQAGLRPPHGPGRRAEGRCGGPGSSWPTRSRPAPALIDRLGLAPERVHTVYYGTDPARFRPADAEPSGPRPAPGSAGTTTARPSRSSAPWATSARGSIPCSRPGGMLARRLGLGRPAGRRRRRARRSAGCATRRPGRAGRSSSWASAATSPTSSAAATPWSARPATRRTA